MIRLLKKIDAIIVIIIFTIVIGVIVTTMRSKTYSIGYELASLKLQEKQLNQKHIELQTQLAELQKSIRENLLVKTNNAGKLKYIMPDKKHVIKEGL